MANIKLNIDQYLEKLSQYNSNISINKESYISTMKPVEAICNICNYQWYPLARKLIEKANPSHCPKCNINKQKIKNYPIRVKNMYGNEYSVLGEYVNNSTKILMKHNICGNTYEVTPINFLGSPSKKPRKCPYCDKFRKKDTIWYKNKVKELTGNEYTVLGKYINTHTKIKMKHNLCGNIYYVEGGDVEAIEQNKIELQKAFGEYGCDESDIMYTCNDYINNITISMNNNGFIQIGDGQRFCHIKDTGDSYCFTYDPE